jgi:hypothetical protein
MYMVTSSGQSTPAVFVWSGDGQQKRNAYLFYSMPKNRVSNQTSNANGGIEGLGDAGVAESAGLIMSSQKR